MQELPKIIAVIGPTASGKSDFAVELALKINGEIISADSRQIYRDLDLGTGKITKEEMRGVQHHMLDIVNPGEAFSVTLYVEQALPIIHDILARGKTPILCGGTGQYIHAILYETSFPKVPPNEALRKSLETKTVEELFTILQEKDSTRALTIDRHNKVRLVRALEILKQEKTIKPLSLRERFSFHIYEMSVEDTLLRKRIEKRIQKRIDLGMLDEIKKVIAMNLSEEKLARCGLEYVELGNYIQNKCSLSEAKQKLFYAIWHYAKRQKRWNIKYFPTTEKIVVKE